MLSLAKLMLLTSKAKKEFIANVDGRITETPENRIHITQFSSVNLLLNTKAWIFWLYHNYKENNNKLNGNFITMNVNAFWIKDAQSDIDIKSVECMEILPRIKVDIVVGGGRTKRWIASTWNKQEFILLSFGHRSSYLVDFTERRLCGHLGLNDKIVRIRSKY